MSNKSSVSSWAIFVGLIVGCLIGFLFNFLENSEISFFLPFLGSIKAGGLTQFITNNIFFPIGDLFLQALFMIIVPLVFSSIIVGISNMSNPAIMGRLGKRLFLFYACSTFIAIFIGQMVMGLFKPGQHIPQEKVAEMAEEYTEKMSSLQEKSSMVGSSLWPGIVRKVVPKNIIDEFGKQNLLAVIFVSILFGLALISMPQAPPKESFIALMSAVCDISIMVIRWVMKTAPVAVACLLVPIVSNFGLDFMKTMVFYILVLSFGMLLHLFGTYSLFLKFLVKQPIRQFFSKMIPVFTTAFGTSSSSATMPVTMNTLEKSFGAPKKIVSFSIPIGVTVNMDGTALFEVAAAIFIAQIYGISLSPASIVLLILLVFITSVGIAGVPGGSIPVLMSSIVVLGLPAEGVAIILGVDRLMDMGRTVVNVTGDSLATLYLARKDTKT